MINENKIRKVVNEVANKVINEGWFATACYVYASVNGGKFQGFDLENGSFVDKLIYCSTLQNDEQTQQHLQELADKYKDKKIVFQLREQGGNVVFQTKPYIDFAFFAVKGGSFTDCYMLFSKDKMQSVMEDARNYICRAYPDEEKWFNLSDMLSQYQGENAEYFTIYYAKDEGTIKVDIDDYGYAEGLSKMKNVVYQENSTIENFIRGWHIPNSVIKQR